MTLRIGDYEKKYAGLNEGSFLAGHLLSL